MYHPWHVPFWLELAALAAAGVAAGAVNVVAAGGSFLTLPLLLFFGLPASLANGTNRMGVLSQNLGGVLGYHRHGVMPWSWALQASIPAIAGAAIGVWAALAVPDFAFKRILSVAMVAITAWSLLRRRQPVPPAELRPPTHWSTTVGFFIVGVYGGFIQAGVGFMVLAITSAAGMDLIRGNAVKVLSVMLLTLLSLVVFAAAGQVDWPRGLALAAGNWVGAEIGVRLAVSHGHKWLEQVVTITVILFAGLLWLG